MTGRQEERRPPPRSTALHDRLRLHVLTDRALARARSTAEVVTAALAGGATVVQLRDKERTGAALVGVGHHLRALTRAHGGLLIVNDRVDVALAIDADGAHVGQDDLPAREARRVLGPDRLLGVSARTVEEAVRAAGEGADYIGFGPVFPTATKGDAGPPRGLEDLRRACRAVTVPIVAIGGITSDNVGDALVAGAAGVAVIAAVVTAPDMAAATRTLREAIRDACRAAGAAGA